MTYRDIITILETYTNITQSMNVGMVDETTTDSIALLDPGIITEKIVAISTISSYDRFNFLTYYRGNGNWTNSAINADKIYNEIHLLKINQAQLENIGIIDVKGIDFRCLYSKPKSLGMTNEKYEFTIMIEVLISK